MEEKILELIKKHTKIIIARHIGGDPDSFGATFALKEIIEENFEDKVVTVVGSSVSKFRFFGTHEKITEDSYNDALLITVDVPDIKRIDGVDFSKFEDVVKMDHHPEIDKFSDYEIVDESASSASEIIALWAYKLGLKIPKHAAENIFIGIVADTNRFLFQSARAETYAVAAKLIKDEQINPTELYAKLYKRSISEVRLEGLISLHMKVTKNGLGYIKLKDSDLKEYGIDSASVGSIMNNYNFINELLVWIVFTEDAKMNVIRTSARSRGPKLNKLFEQYNGGGHVYACGAKLKSFSEADEIIDKLDSLCLNYKEEDDE